MRWLWIFVLQGCFLLGGGRDIEGMNPGECSDGADNDADGLFDCNDDNCAGAPDCTSPGGVTGSVTGGPATSTETPSGTSTSPQTGTTTGGTSTGGKPTSGTTTGSSGTTGTGTPTSSTATTFTGPPIANPSALNGRTYEVDLAGGTWVSPPGAGAILSSLIDTEIYFHVLDATATTLDARIAFGDGSGAQELCATTLDIPGGDFTANPHFVVAEQTALWQCTVALNMSDVEYSGAFRATLDAVEVGRFAAEVEVGQLSALLGGDSCKLLATVGFSCTPCTYLQSQDCLEMEVTSMTWSEVAVPIVQRTSSDLANDPNCSTTTTSTPTQSGGTGSPATP